MVDDCDAKTDDLAERNHELTTVATALGEAHSELSRPGALESSLAHDGSPRYAPVRLLGRGGMGEVTLAIDRGLGRPVALKRALARVESGRLLAEARICAQLEHPAIVPVYDLVGGDGAEGGYTMRAIAGRTLGAAIEETRTGSSAGGRASGVAKLLAVMRHVCLAVDYAHSRGVVHCDLKPSNVVLGTFGEVYVLDWGIACVTPASDLVGVPRSARTWAATPRYMAPEQGRDEPLTTAADVHALGVMLCDLLGAEPSAGPEALGAFAELVGACLQAQPARRPSARAIADAIEEHLDGERVRREREREAAADVAAAESSLAASRRLGHEATEVRRAADAILRTLPEWASANEKRPAWVLASRAERLRADAVRQLLWAETAFGRALARSPSSPTVRRGLCRLHCEALEAAEQSGDHAEATRRLELARSFDDGRSAALGDEGEIVVEPCEPAPELEIARYALEGPLYELFERQPLTPGGPRRLSAGSYLVVARVAGREPVRAPVVIERARRHIVRLRLPRVAEWPSGMLPIPGGPFWTLSREGRRKREQLPDFAIGRFPVTMAEYALFLDALPPAERERRLPGARARRPLLERDAGGWRLAARAVEGDAARARVPPHQALALPVHEITWFSALAYVTWLRALTGRAYRLPSDLEWDKAMRGVDGRRYPMAEAMDPSFAKLRGSRPEATQPEPIGAFSLDESPYGVRDLAGGFGDWTATALDGEPPPSLAEEASAQANARQVYWRGGNWGISGLGPEMRYPMSVDRATSGVSFRVVLELEAGSSLLTEPLGR